MIVERSQCDLPELAGRLGTEQVRPAVDSVNGPALSRLTGVGARKLLVGELQTLEYRRDRAFQ